MTSSAPAGRPVRWEWNDSERTRIRIHRALADNVDVASGRLGLGRSDKWMDLIATGEA
jgi:hypothetical protein